MGRPILTLVIPEGDAGQIVRKLRAGVVMVAEETKGTAHAVLEMYNVFCRGELAVNSDLIEIL